MNQRLLKCLRHMEKVDEGKFTKIINRTEWDVARSSKPNWKRWFEGSGKRKEERQENTEK